MKLKTALLVLAMATLAPIAASACDEACQKEAAEKKLNVDFPGYLSWNYCDDIRMDFMTSSVRSLDDYRTNHFDLRYKGGIQNIVQYLDQRKEWLKECDQYLSATGKGRIFDDEATTRKIYSAIDSVKAELQALIKGVTYSAEVGQDSTTVMNERFEHLFQVVEDHKTLMHLKGKYVIR